MSTASVDKFYKNLTALALTGRVPQADIEQARQEFVQYIEQGEQESLLSKLFSVDPRCASEVNMLVTDFLDNVSRPDAYWTNSIAIPFSVINNDKAFSPRITPAQQEAITKLFSVPCKAVPHLFNPWELEIILWDDWLKYSQKIFSPKPLKLVLSQKPVSTEDLTSSFILLLHFNTVSSNQLYLLEAVGLQIQAISDIIAPVFSGREFVPMNGPVPAHMAYATSEQIAFRIELAKWSLRLGNEPYVVREEYADKKYYLSLWDKKETPLGFIPQHETLPWIMYSRWEILREWLEEHPNVTLQQSQELTAHMSKSYQKELNRIPKLAYVMNPEVPQTTPIGFTIITKNGPAVDKELCLPVFLTEQQAASLALKLKFSNGDEYQVAPLTFSALYVLAMQHVSLRIERNAYLRFLKACASCSLPGFPIQLPPQNAAEFHFVTYDQILPHNKLKLFEHMYGHAIKQRALEWLAKRKKPSSQADNNSGA